jgi:hypothetical protein
MPLDTVQAAAVEVPILKNACKEVQLIGALDHVVRSFEHDAQVSREQVARATAWLAERYKQA